LPFGHAPEEHRHAVFESLGPEYGSEEEQRKVGLWLSVAADECAGCSQRLVWLLAKDVGAVVSLGKVVKLLFTSAPPPEGAHEELTEFLQWSTVSDRAELVVEIANDFIARRREAIAAAAASLGDAASFLGGVEERGEGFGVAREDPGEGAGVRPVLSGGEQGLQGAECGQEGDGVP